MSRQAVRRAVQKYIVDALIEDLNAVNLAPIGIDDPETFLADGKNYGCTSYLWIESDTEVTLTAGAGPPAPAGWRMVRYNMALIFDWFALGVATDDDEWSDKLDVMIEAVKTLIRNDPKLGNAEVIFAAGNEYPDQQTPSISVVMGEPQDVEDSSAVTVHGGIVFPVYAQVRPGE